ncbi:Ankyrin repeat and MYND domain-containing protein 2 [Portunus trituberculatus]|uniref:Ankyrin repeat and MYND domain-containing protein 2 n=1 Tax=Portunus trituberculatus TaxID=210409 RepID=A0A5B7IYS8_PORTR|nr:Ankyrin repeat and MYND domain-containing protein 2 [Portunus trituberculatus]
MNVVYIKKCCSKKSKKLAITLYWYYSSKDDKIKLLFSQGSDVNSDSHDHRYSPLHFAALSGNIEAVRHLLTAGARTYHTNTLGRTATQMAAFVGNHAVVALINNYVPLSDVTQYTTPSGLEKEAKLPSIAAKAVYDLIMQVNLHPVRIALIVGGSDILQMNISKTWRLLEHMCEKESKRSENVNEVSKGFLILSIVANLILLLQIS